jgi:hypothetical protein
LFSIVFLVRGELSWQRERAVAARMSVIYPMFIAAAMSQKMFDAFGIGGDGSYDFL